MNAATVLMPDAEPSWRLWRSMSASRTEPVDSPADFQEVSKDLIVGLPATACRTLGMMLPAADTAVLRGMIEAQLEKRGITIEQDSGPNYVFHILARTAVSVVVSVDVLIAPFPDHLVVKRAANYTAALRMMSLPPSELAVVDEQGQVVVAANQQGKLCWHSHVIGNTETSPAADLARELDIAKLEP